MNYQQPLQPHVQGEVGAGSAMRASHVLISCADSRGLCPQNGKLGKDYLGLKQRFNLEAKWDCTRWSSTT